MTTTRRAATTITALILALAATLALAGTAHATRRGGEATTHHRTANATSWIQPPTNLDTFRNIYGGRATGFIADHIDTSTGGWVNTMWPPRHVILFQYCENKAKGPSNVLACQEAWDGFYTWMRDHRDGTLQDWIEQQYPHH